MRLSYATRRFAALLALMGVLFTQMTVPAYACPSREGGIEGGRVAQTPSEARAMSAGCEELDQASPSLCLQQWQVGNQLIDQSEVPNVAPVLAVLYFVTLPDAAAPRLHPGDVDRDFLVHETSPPLAIRNCCFRI